ncbi:AAA family ATPase [Bradyrhizobium sp. MOS001]|nr:AAA family ATPase [Bradyrhizobium sp. MOS001]
MDECAEVGVLTFMETYGFSWGNVEYYISRDADLFPAKAIFAVAHQYRSGAPLDSKNSDGTVAREHLASLGFDIVKRGAILLFSKDGHPYEPILQTNSASSRRAYRYKPAGASNRTEDAIETNDLVELARALFIDKLAVRIANGGSAANYLTYPGQKFKGYWLRPDLADALGKESATGIGDDQMLATEKPRTGAPSNIILHGPPGTGKTWRTAREAVRLCDGSVPADRMSLMARYTSLEAEKRIAFVTFHQSMDYENFVEGLRPETEESETGGAGFRLEPRPGIFREICALADQARLAPSKSSNALVDLENHSFWKMGLGAIGTDDDVYEDAIAGGYIVLGWGGDQDWSDARFESAAEVEKVWKEKNREDTSPSNYTQLWPFRAKMKKGDIVIVPFGNSAFRAVAEVTGDYQYVRGEDGHYNHRRSVRWLLKLAEPLPLDTIVEGKFTMRTLYQITESRLNKAALRRLLAAEEPVPTGSLDQFVLIIDEINRANISKVLGELITLIEPDKRLGQPNALEVLLPYSRKPFGVPDNLHIIGTMNTADRSIALLDTALRRRFRFVEVEPEPALLQEAAVRTGIPLMKVLQTLNDRIEYLLDREHRIGHAFFVDCNTRYDVDHAMRDKVIPLLQEYFFEDWSRVAAVLGEQTEPPGSSRRGHFLECRRLKDPTVDGGPDRVSWSVRRDDANGGFAHDAYDRLIGASVPEEGSAALNDDAGQ